MGNPHWVLFDRPVGKGVLLPDEARAIGPRLETHPSFPERANVEFVRELPASLRVSVWERGVGLTLGCGTGACAVVAAAVKRGIRTAFAWHPVNLDGGTVEVRVSADLGNVELRGPATFVFEASLP